VNFLELLSRALRRKKCATLLTIRGRIRQLSEQNKRRRRPNMGAEWNKFIDHTGIRMGLIAVAVTVWAVTLVGLLSLAA
jgi:hypothetical protein